MVEASWIISSSASSRPPRAAACRSHRTSIELFLPEQCAIRENAPVAVSGD